MDRRVIEQKLEALRHCVRRIEEKCPPEVAFLAGNPDAQDLVTLNLIRAVQLCVDIGAHLIAATEVPVPQTMGQTFEALVQAGLIDQALASRLGKAVGFRNIAVHSYEKIDWAIVYSLCKNHLGDFSSFAKAVTRVLQ